MKNNIIKIIAVSFLLKLSYFVFALIVSELGTGYQIELKASEFFSLFKRNDSFWYQKEAEQGYPKIINPSDLGYSHGKDFKQSEWAHFPLYPLSIRLIQKIFNLEFDYSAFILSIIFSIGAFIAFYFLCIDIFKIDPHESFIYTLFFMFFPFHYYYSMYYTEAVFFTFLAFSFITVSRKKYLITSILIVPLTLVRPNGIICLIPLVLYFFEVEGGFNKIYLDFKMRKWARIRNLQYFISGPIAFGLYCIYQKQMTDHYFAFIKAQDGWGKEFMFPLFGLFRRSDFTSQFNSMYSIVFMIIGLFAWKKLPLSLNILIWISILLPLASGSAACMPRYISLIFPLTIYIASILLKIRLKYFILIGLLLLQYVTFYPWLIYHPFSF
jgi:Gpi18-like mannosyltransferase